MNKNETVFLLIKERYFQLERDYDKLAAFCKTDAEKKQLAQDYMIARANYRVSLNTAFDNDEPVIKDLIDILKNLEDKINNDIKAFGITANIFKMISESVKVASSILILAVSFT